MQRRSARLSKAILLPDAQRDRTRHLSRRDRLVASHRTAHSNTMYTPHHKRAGRGRGAGGGRGGGGVARRRPRDDPARHIAARMAHKHTCHLSRARALIHSTLSSSRARKNTPQTTHTPAQTCPNDMATMAIDNGYSYYTLTYTSSWAQPCALAPSTEANRESLWARGGVWGTTPHTQGVRPAARSCSRKASILA